MTPPFTDLAAVFDATQVAGSGRAILRAVAGGTIAAPVVPTRHVSAGAAKMEAVFDPCWENASRLGLVLNTTAEDGEVDVIPTASHAPASVSEANHGYYFTMYAMASQEDEPGPLVPKSVVTTIKSGGAVVLEIRRGGSRLRTMVVDRADLPHGPLRMTASKVGDRLQWAVGNLADRIHRRLSFDEQRRGEIRRLLAGRNQAACPRREPAANARGSQPARTRRFALRRRAHSRGTRCFPGAGHGHSLPKNCSSKCAYKQALCLLALRRDQEGDAILEALSNQRASRWTALATCQLWLHQVQQNRFDETEAIFANLSGKYRIEQLTTFVPSELHEQIVEGYASLGVARNLLRPNPARVEQCERAVAIADLFDPQHVSVSRIVRDLACLRLLRAYRMLGQEEEALKRAEKFVRDASRFGKNDVSVTCEYSWLLRVAGRADQGVGEADQASVPNVHWARTYNLERVRNLSALARFDEAEALLKRMIAAVRPEDADSSLVSAYGMLGVLRQHRGDEQGAIESWKEGAKTHWVAHVHVAGTTFVEQARGHVPGW